MIFKTLSASLKSNGLALVSLLLALFSVFYGIYRNEVTESNMNKRESGFEMLKNLNELQLIVNRGHYEMNQEGGNPVLGWGHIAFIGDLSILLSERVQRSAVDLTAVWREEANRYKESEESAEKISQAIDAVRFDVRAELSSLR